MVILGPIGSRNDNTTNSDYILSLSNYLGTGEYLTGTPEVESIESEITISEVIVNTGTVTGYDGTSVPSGEGIIFNVQVSGELIAISPITAYFQTTAGRADNAQAFIRVVAAIT